MQTTIRRTLDKYVKFCPRSGKIKGIKPGISRLCLPLLGLLSVIWIIIRVTPKPSRINYPCMKVAAPLASGFLTALAGSAIAILLVKKIRPVFRTGLLVILAGAIIGSCLTTTPLSSAPAPAPGTHPPNAPMGEAQGIYPGRVIWVHAPGATNEDCHPTARGDGWFDDKNNNQETIDDMLESAILAVTGKKTTAAAWEAIFQHHNEGRGKGKTGYKPGEIIFIKINATSAWEGNYDRKNLARIKNGSYGIAETSPQLVLSVLRQLVHQAGVPQRNISIGDPMKHIYLASYSLWHSEFPDIHYLDNYGFTNQGREVVEASTRAVIKYADKGTVLRTGSWSRSPGQPVKEDYLYTIFEKMEYMLNIPTLKGHRHAGITMFAKNHFGSITRPNAQHLHSGLVNPHDGTAIRGEYGLYRVLVDMMGHELLGKKNLIYLMDALWTADYEINAPSKWNMPPFKGDWTSSLFLSQDPVAIESVGFDFLRTELNGINSPQTYPNQAPGVDDYLHQAADPSTWPKGIIYDPEGDGTPLESLGVHEHWNNSTDMKYSRNLGTGKGIELIKIRQ